MKFKIDLKVKELAKQLKEESTEDFITIRKKMETILKEQKELCEESA